jgi:hypothetical protein
MDASAKDASAKDASSADAAPDAGKTLPAECPRMESLPLPDGYEAFKTVISGNLVAANGVVYGADDQLWRFPEPSGPAEGLPIDIYGGPGNRFQDGYAVDGADIFYASLSELSSLRVTRYTPADDTSVNIAFINAADDAGVPLGNVESIVVDGDAVYWLLVNSNGSSQTSYLMRSDREPGTTTMITSVAGQAVDHALQLLADTFYFAAYPTGSTDGKHTQFYRVPKAGGTAEPLGTPAGVHSLASDGTQLFAGLVSVPDQLNNPSGDHGVARVNLADGTLTLLFSTPDVQVVAVDAENLYWSTDSGASVKLWRGKKDGSGAAVNFAQHYSPDYSLVLTDSAIYWVDACGSSSPTPTYLVRAAK